MATSNFLARWITPNRYYGTKLGEEDGYSLCTIEFDDQGELWEPQQRTEVLKLIQKKCKYGHQNASAMNDDEEIIVITFLHGWMHNASREDPNFESFRKILENKASAEKDFARDNNRRPRPIIGVYIGWRGMLSNVPGLKYLTFWSRKAAALRVGNLSCTEVIFSIIRAVKSRNPRSQCIFIGHSFGGLALENAVCKALLGSIFLNSVGTSDSPTDLLVLINPACEASNAKQFIDILKRNEIEVVIGGRKEKGNLPFPLLISITSEGDRATKFAFPVGQFLVNLFKSFRPYKTPPKGFPTQYQLCLQTAGHLPYFHNIELKKIEKLLDDKDRLQFSFNCGVDYYYEVVPRPNQHNAPPFWLMRLPTNIVPDHSNIFRTPFENMLSALLHWRTTSTEPTKLDCNSVDEQAETEPSPAPPVESEQTPAVNAL
jgi:hypothetical protein